LTKDSVPMMFSSYKSSASEKDACCCCSNNTQIFSNNLRGVEHNYSKERSIHQNTFNNFDSYIQDDKKKVFELERQMGYLIQDNK
jgi:hypothetical protein